MKEGLSIYKKVIFVFSIWFIIGLVTSAFIFYSLGFEPQGALVIIPLGLLAIFVLVLTIPLAIFSIRSKSKKSSRILLNILVIILAIHLFLLITSAHSGMVRYNIRATVEDPNSNISLEYCQMIQSSNERDYCYIRLANETKDPSLCLRISSSGNNNFVKKACLGNIATSTLNYSICDMIEDNLFCKVKVSAISGSPDEEICENTETLCQKRFCYCGYIESQLSIQECYEKYGIDASLVADCGY